MGETGVIMTENCEFQVDKEKFQSREISQCEVNVYVEKLLAEIWPHHSYVEYLVKVLNQQQNSEQTIQALTAALVEFSINVLINELQLIENFPHFADEEKWAILYNVRSSK
jgi:hypothetical protein